jgi:hypothetical protein
MKKFGCSGVAAGLIGGAMLLYGAVPATLRYSTVTDLARLRGWSTSVPRNTAA